MQRTGEADKRPKEQEDASKQAQDEADPKTVNDPAADSLAPLIPSAVVTPSSCIPCRIRTIR